MIGEDPYIYSILGIVFIEINLKYPLLSNDSIPTKYGIIESLFLKISHLGSVISRLFVCDITLVYALCPIVVRCQFSHVCVYGCLDAVWSRRGYFVNS